MPLKLLTAGCSDEEKARLETLVRSVIGQRAKDAAWSVSLVRIGGKWSVSLDGPHEALRARSFIVAESDLRDAILDALREAGMARPATGAMRAVTASEPVRPEGERRDQHACPTCKKDFMVVYEAFPNEARRSVPVACPHCWQTSDVPVGEWAASGQEYRAEKL